MTYNEEIGEVIERLLNIDFSASKPNDKRVTDIIESLIFREKLYISPLLDLFDGKIISYSITSRPHLGQVIEMLDIAFKSIMIYVLL